METSQPQTASFSEEEFVFRHKITELLANAEINSALKEYANKLLNMAQGEYVELSIYAELVSEYLKKTCEQREIDALIQEKSLQYDLLTKKDTTYSDVEELQKIELENHLEKLHRKREVASEELLSIDDAIQTEKNRLLLNKETTNIAYEFLKQEKGILEKELEKIPQKLMPSGLN